jgi:DNA-directed RNA polymerase subunit beta'
MLSNKNILGPKDGKLILSPSQDIILGMYYLTKVKENGLGSRRMFGNYTEVENFLITKQTHIHSVVAMPLSSFGKKFSAEMKDGYKYVVTTVGRILMNRILPELFPYMNSVTPAALKGESTDFLVKDVKKLDETFAKFEQEIKPLKKADVNRIIEVVFENQPEDIANVLDEIKALGFKYSMISGASMAMSDIVDIQDRDAIIESGARQVDFLKGKTTEGILTDDQRYKEVISV